MKLNISGPLAVVAFTYTALAQSQPFRLVAASSNPDINMRSINASGEALWINRDTASYCPSTIVPNCPAGNSTSFVGGNGGLSMNVEGMTSVLFNPQS
jgi:hypothetical protein